MANQRKLIFKIIIILIFILLIYFSVKYFLPMCKQFNTESGRAKISEFVEKAGIFAPLLFILLMALQIVIAFLPGGPLEITAGMLFGGLFGTIFAVMGTVLGTLAVYGLVKKFGRPLVHFFISEEKIKKFSVLEDEERLSFWVFVLFLIPGIPKDLLTYIVPLTKMSGKQFLLLSALARFPALAVSVVIGSNFIQGKYWLCVVIACIATVIAIFGFRMKNKILNKKESN
ncbi:MAG: TVP38/TMEM64 family protein [Oscillospiraceae bacterium]|nr:TVP38/TMEM64 family protein [Oscillospiraceae bacterium]